MARASTISMAACLRRWRSVHSNENFHIDKVYYWNGDEVAVVFQVRNHLNELVDQFESYTKAERKICDMLEKSNHKTLN